MGSRMLAVVENQNDDPPFALGDVPVWFEEWEQVLSRFRSDSELCRLNIQSGTPVEVSPILWEVFQASLNADRLTGGLVSPLILDALVHAGYDRSFDALLDHSRQSFDGLESAGLMEMIVSPALLQDVSVNHTSHTIELPRGVRLDFGGVAKSWSAHRAAEKLKAAGPTLIAAGGDIAVSGPRTDGSAWPIDVADPFHEGQCLETIQLESGGVATSGKDYRHWTRAGVPQHHIIDPRTGLPAQTDILTATVIAPTVMEAEALAKAVLISGSLAGLDWLNENTPWEGILVLENGETRYSRNMNRYL